MKNEYRAMLILECVLFLFIFATLFQCVHYPIKGNPDWWQIHWMSEIGVVFFFPVVIIPLLFSDVNFLNNDIYSFGFITISAAIHVIVIHLALTKILKLIHRFKRTKS
jgi:hypothetical protein